MGITIKFSSGLITSRYTHFEQETLATATT